MKSRDIRDYFSIELGNIKPFVPITFDIYLYFESNNHVLLWRKEGFSPTDEFIADYSKRGIQKIWIHHSEKEAYLAYLSEKGPAEIALQTDAKTNAPPPVSTQETVAASTKAEPPPPPVEEEKETPSAPPAAVASVEIAESKELTEEQKKKAISEAAHDVLQQTFGPESKNEADKKADSQKKDDARDFVKHFVAPPPELKKETKAVLDQIWESAHQDKDLEHSANVGTLAVLFAMSFGNIQRTDLWELATAGLLHDVGLGQMKQENASLLWSSLSNPALSGEYEKHVSLSVDMIQELAPELSEKIRLYVGQHHEKFDGSGYPGKIRSFDINDFSQLIAVADLIDSMCSGRWDGKKRGLEEAVQALKALEKSGTFPRQFNPEILRGCMRAISKKDFMAVKEAAGLVNNLTEQMTKREAS